MVQLSSTQAAVTAVQHAHDVTFLAYTLRRGAVLDALEAAAKRGAHVCVRLEGAPFNDASGGLARLNARTIAELTDCGADAQCSDGGGHGMPMHAKTLLADAELFLDDRNFGASDFVVTDSERHAAAAVRAVAAGNAPASSGEFAIGKRDALAKESALLDTADRNDDVIVESESFGYGQVCSELERLAHRGVAVRLLVASREAAGNLRERNALQRLRNDGVAVRVCPDSEKFAVVGSGAWLGSANASPAFGAPTIDWGLCTDDATIVSAARQRVESRWARARAWRA